MRTVRICCVVGARPNFVKLASLIGQIRCPRWRSRFEPTIIHTGQHFSPEMSESFFQELAIPVPDINLGVCGGTQTQQTAEIMRRLEPALLESAPEAILVVGDVNSTVASALVAAKMGIRIAHVEAGLRSFDRRMPEEINRLVTDALSDLLFVTEPSGLKNLLTEGVPENRIFFVGNVMIDTLLRFRSRSLESDVLERFGLTEGNYVAVTIHRPSNVDDTDRLFRLLNVLSTIARQIPVVFPIHPRTHAKIREFGIPTGGIAIFPPLGYLDFIRLIADARVVLTDSGGVQEETTVLQVRCLTLRDNTERPITIEQGSNRLIGTEPEVILRAVRQALDEPSNVEHTQVPELWDGRASERIVDILSSELA